MQVKLPSASTWLRLYLSIVVLTLILQMVGSCLYRPVSFLGFKEVAVAAGGTRNETMAVDCFVKFGWMFTKEYFVFQK